MGKITIPIILRNNIASIRVKSTLLILLFIGSFGLTQISAQDTDGDFIPDAVDLDDDNDGIKDINESVCDLSAASFPGLVWDANRGTLNGNTGVAKVNRYEPVTVNSASFEQNALPAVFGSGLTDESTLNTPNNVQGEGYYYVSGADAPDIATARTNNDYVEFEFNTLDDLTSLIRTLSIHDIPSFVNGSYLPGLGANLGADTVLNPIYSDYTFQIEISADNFVTSSVLVSNRTTSRLFDNSSFSGPPTPASSEFINLGASNAFPFLDGTSYKIRMYIYDSQAPRGFATFDNFAIRTSVCPVFDFDGDGIPNSLDLDSDNDGIYDLVESGDSDAVDGDNDGRVGVGISAVGTNGIPDLVEATPDNGVVPLPVNSFGSDGANFLDIDSDDDGIVDNIEAQTTAGYISPIGVDSDNDGIDDRYDPVDDTNIAAPVAGSGTAIAPVNTDASLVNNDLIPDYLDLDSDGDFESDTIEAYDTNQDGIADTLPANADTDADGLDDNFDVVVLGSGTIATNSTNGGQTASNPFPDLDMPGAEPDWRDANDTDGDGVPDSVDLDDDNDGILDSVEDPNNDGDGNPNTGNPLDIDPDGDGIPNHLDIDSDNDGIPDNVEAQPTAGYQPPSGNVGANGLDANYENNDSPTATGLDTTLPAVNNDDDGIPDYLDINSDNDGLIDTLEAGLALPVNKNDTDGDGLLDAFDVDNASNDSNNNLDNGSVDTPNTDVSDSSQVDTDVDYRDALEPLDTDGDGVPDALDLDDDNDGIPDLIESGCPVSTQPNSTMFIYANDGNTNSAQGSDPNLVSSANDQTFGSGISAQFNAFNLDYLELDGVDQPSLSAAKTDNDFIEYKFISGSAPYTIKTLFFFAEANNARTSVPMQPIFAGYKYTAEISADNFATPGLEVFAEGTANEQIDTPPNAFRGTPTNVFQVAKNTNYTIRLYLYDNPDALGRATIDNVSFRGQVCTLDDDFDNDGIANSLDLDSDNDGIYDLLESRNPAATDSNNDGRIDTVGVVSVGVNGIPDEVDSDNDSYSATVVAPENRNGTDGPNYLDIDADDDGIQDNIESQTTSGYRPPSGIDSDNDGIDDAYDPANDSNVSVPVPGSGVAIDPSLANADGLGNPDYLDIDSDEDGQSDNLEAYDTDNDGVIDIAPANTDLDGDGLDDNYDTIDLSVNPNANPTDNNELASNFPDADNPGNDRDWREKQISAEDDTFTSVATGTTGEPNLGNVLTNTDPVGIDTISGVQATVGGGGNVTINVVTPAAVLPTAPSGNTNIPSIDVATGLVSFPANTPAGTYTITYEIVDATNPANKDLAVVTVVVPAPSILAEDDTLSPAAGITAAGNVLAANPTTNDVFNGAPATVGGVDISIDTPASPLATAPSGNVVVPLLDTANGDVTIPSGTPPGIYTIDYTITDKINLTNNDSATVTVTVPATVVANTDTATIDGTTGGTIPNVVDDNDTVNGNPAELGVSVTITSVTNPTVSTGGITLDPATGEVTVAVMTPPGVYTIPYEICAVAPNGTSCNSTIVTVTVPATVVANIDGETIDGTTGGIIANVVDDNDTVNGNPAELGVSVTITSVTNPTVSTGGITLDPATGVVTVDPLTPPGVYTVNYTICEITNPSNCGNTTVEVTVGSTLDAMDDVASINTIGGVVPNIVNSNDLENGNPVVLGTDVIITNIVDSDLLDGVTLDPLTGEVTIAPNTTASIYIIKYMICSVINPSNCDDAIVTITITPDADADGIIDDLDFDDDNDGITDIDEMGGDPTRDTDNDGIIDRLDLDADGDGVLDVYESGIDTTSITIDSDGRIVNGDGSPSTVGTDGVPDSVQISGDENSGATEYQIKNTDGDAKNDFQDMDDDDDGVLSKFENPNNEGTGQDSDADGMPDYLDLDDDGDGILTKFENPNSDNDKDPNTGDTQDTDADGIPDYLDADDDNDNIPTIEEGPDLNKDGNPEDAEDLDVDGVADYLEFNNSNLNAIDGIEIFNAISPNGDGENDVLIISGLMNTISNSIKIYNRWGVLVYETSQYGENGNIFRGFSNGRVTVKSSDRLPTGTYYYVFEYKISNTSKEASRAGYLYIN